MPDIWEVLFEVRDTLGADFKCDSPSVAILVGELSSCLHKQLHCYYCSLVGKVQWECIDGCPAIIVLTLQ